MLPNRQSYLDYSGDTTKTKETYSKPNETNPPQSRNSYQKDVTNTQQSSQPKRSQSPKNKVFKKARRNSADYKINPDVIPRPRHVEDIYRNPTTKSLTYETNEETLPPFSTSYFNVKEINNSSPRFIRSSIVKLPLDQETINKSSLIFGLHVQPFSELIEGDSSIPQVEVNEDILRCSRCNTYINNKFEMKFVGNNKRVAVCNCCNYSIDLATGNIKVKPEYMAMDISSIPELSSPTIDFVAPTKFLPKHTFNPSYGVFIDVSQLSIDLGFASYVLNSISSSLESFHNKDNSNIFISTYDANSIHFYIVDSSGDVKVLFVSDIDQPFSPVPKEKLLLNISSNKEHIEKVIEKIQNFISTNFFNSGKSLGAATGAAIFAGKEVFKGGAGGRVIVLACNQCSSGFGNSKANEISNHMNTDKEKSLYSPQNDLFAKLALDSVENDKTVFDLFVLQNNKFDLASVSQVTNITGGSCHYYTIENNIDLKYQYEKLHYDLSRIFSRPNYNNVAFKLRASAEIDIVELLGTFGKRPGSAISLAGCDPDYSLNFICRINNSLKIGGKVHFQLAVIFTDNYNQRFLRTINYTILTTIDVSTMYKSIDVDTLTKITFCKELLALTHTGYASARTDLINKMVSALHYYRETSSKGSSASQLILPECYKYYPLYLNSLMKKPVTIYLNKILRINKVNVSINILIDFINTILRDPLHITIKSLYPKLYRVDDITTETPEIVERLRFDKDITLDNIGAIIESTTVVQKPYIHALTIERVCFEGAYIMDTGHYIYFVVFNETNENFLSEVFKVNSFEELVQQYPESLDETNENDINIRIFNIINQLRNDNRGIFQPLKLLFINDVNLHAFEEFTSNLIEDGYRGETSYIDFLCETHSTIQNRKALY